MTKPVAKAIPAKTSHPSNNARPKQTSKASRKAIPENLKEVFPAAYRDRLRTRSYQKGQVICQQGQTLSSLSYLYQGQIKIIRQSANGKDVVLDSHQTPMIIGDIELLTGKGAVTTVIATSQTDCLELALHQPEQLLADRDFLYRLAKGLALSFYQQNIRSSLYQSYSSKDRLVTYLLDHAEDDHIRLSLTDLSDFLGCSYRHLSRLMKDFLSKGLLQKIRWQEYRINRHALEALASIPED